MLKALTIAHAGAWDIALVGADPDRAQLIDFSSAYVEIQATYMVPVDSKFTSIEQVDCEGTRIATKGGGAYDLWLTRNLHHAELLRAASLDASYDLFHDQKLEALSGLRCGEARTAAVGVTGLWKVKTGCRSTQAPRVLQSLGWQIYGSSAGG